MSFLARGLSNLIGLIVPIVQAFKILKKPTNKKLTQSVHYWSVYGSFLITDWLLTTFFISCFIPFYDFFVLMFTVLMAVPQIGFAAMMYTKFLAPFLRKYERRIDRFTAKIADKVWERMPILAVSIPAALHSLLATILEPPVTSTMEVEELDSSIEIRQQIQVKNQRQRLAVPNRSVEMQSDDDEELDFQAFPDHSIVREIKQEVVEDEEIDEVEEIRPVRRVLRTRRATRSQSVM